MLYRIGSWSINLSDTDKSNEDLIKLHTRTGRPLGSADFLRKLELITSAELAPKKPGREVVNRK